jgi:hypothetical protein
MGQLHVNTPVEIPLRNRYLHQQVKKISAPKGSGTSGSSKKKRHPGPALLQKPGAPDRTRVLVLDAGTGSRHWTWR